MTSSTVEYLRALPTIRERCESVFQLGLAGQLTYVRLCMDRLPAVVEYCLQIIDRDYASNLSSTPPHGRWRHFDAKGVGRIDQLLAQWRSDQVDVVEQTRRLVELFVVSVLLDAGAGSTWSYQPTDEPGASYARSEGLAVASYYMFTSGLFSADPAQPCRVDAKILSRLSVAQIQEGFQANRPGNEMTGLEGRAQLLARLGKCISQDRHAYFSGAHGPPRLGHLVDTIRERSEQNRVSLDVVWKCLLHGFSSIWPDRIMIHGESLGDVWPCPALLASLPEPKTEEQGYVPFHKLTQWMTYSLIEPLQRVLGCMIDGVEQLTGLPEYRNGGLFMDSGVIVPTSSLYEASESNDPLSCLPATHPAVVEWRAVTVILLDRVHAALAERLGVTTQELSLAQVLEAATWKAGREIAKARRPDDGGPPIRVLSDGTLF